MRTAIVYASVHHGNTEKLVKRIAEECQVDLIDAVKQPDADLSSYGPNVSYPLQPNFPTTLACFLSKICSMDL